MPLDLNMMNASVRIVGDVPDKSLIGYHRGPVGTGFMVAVASEADPAIRYGYVVTAHHVLDGQSQIEVQVLDPLVVGREQLLPPVPISDWRQPLPRVDLAIAPFSSEVTREDGVPVTAALRVEKHFLPPKYSPMLGGHVYYIGVFDPENRVMARSGTLGALFQEDVGHDGDYVYLSHFVDCRSYMGFSGSPCYVQYSFAKLTPMEEFPLPMLPLMEEQFPLGGVLDLVLLCGMFTEHVDERVPGEAVSKYGVGVMLPSQYIWAALETPALRDERREWDKMNKETREDDAGPQIRKASIQADTLTENEFERFQDLTRKLVNTPKSEIDELRKREGGD
jgi:hypothetical protein